MSDFNPFQFTKHFAYSFHNLNAKELRNNAIDNDDLSQEAILYLIQFIRDIRDGKFEDPSRKTIIPKDISGIELKKLIGTALFYKFRVMRRSCLRYNEVFGYTSKDDLFTSDEGDLLEFALAMDEEGFGFKDIEGLIPDNDFKILYKRYKENKTFKEIGQDFDVSPQYIKQKFDKILTFLRKIKKLIFVT